MVLVFPSISHEEAHEYVDKVQALLKPEFVEKGLMIGEFHRSNNTPALHSSALFPLRTPYPSLAIRHMVPSDLPFLVHEERLLRGYLRVFRNDPSPSTQRNVEKAEEVLQRSF